MRSERIASAGLGYEPVGVRGEIRTRNNAVLDRTRLPVAPPEHWWAVEDLNLGDPNGIPGLQPGAFSLSANCPNANCQRSGGRQATRTPMSRGAWLSRPVGYQLPEPSGQNYNLDLEEITDLVRDTKSVRLRVGTIGGRD